MVHAHILQRFSKHSEQRNYYGMGSGIFFDKVRSLILSNYLQRTGGYSRKAKRNIRLKLLGLSPTTLPAESDGFGPPIKLLAGYNVLLLVLDFSAFIQLSPGMACHGLLASVKLGLFFFVYRISNDSTEMFASLAYHRDPNAQHPVEKFAIANGAKPISLLRRIVSK